MKPAVHQPEPLLQVEALRVTLSTAAGPAEALRGVSFQLARGGTLGLIGESGCGKSLTALALMGLLPESARAQGQVRFEGRDLLTLPEAEWCRLRGARLGMVFQEPMSALNPLHRIGAQVAEPLRLHHGLSAAAGRAEALRLLERVQMPQARERLDAWPHQLSGGQRQRVVLAIALACRPALLIADEPTTALDATLQREMLALVRRLVHEDGMALLLISHDLGVMADCVDDLLVMYAGQVVERGPVEAVFARRAHPYTRGLHAARPRLGQGRMGRPGQPPLPTIPGRVPALTALPPGCSFAPRCSLALPACSAELPPEVSVSGSHAARCIRAAEPVPAAGARS